jgi:anti-sigma regulatory factor (Ser/Thr protein kinase)
MNVVDVPASLDAGSFDQLVAEVDQAHEGKVLFDARHLRWVDPYGMVGLLAAGRVVRDRTGVPSRMQLSEGSDTVSYLSRMGFFSEAEDLFELDVRVPRRTGRDSDVLLEITPIATNSDVHAVVDRVQTRAGTILSKILGYPPSAVVQFSVILSEVCQNIIEHAEAPGWVAAQTYNWARRLGRHVLVIAVTDLGRGFRGSLADEHSARFGDRWADATALEAAFIHGLTRFPDSGRGQGIQQIRKQVRRWDGSISIRSGTARIADVPDWDDAPPLADGLAPFPGAQINIVLPARAPENE